jgi:hypothetical protein
MIAVLNVTPEVSRLNFNLQNDFCILIRVFKERMAAERLNQGLTLICWPFYLISCKPAEMFSSVVVHNLMKYL